MKSGKASTLKLPEISTVFQTKELEEVSKYATRKEERLLPLIEARQMELPLCDTRWAFNADLAKQIFNEYPLDPTYAVHKPLKDMLAVYPMVCALSHLTISADSCYRTPRPTPDREETAVKTKGRSKIFRSSRPRLGLVRLSQKGLVPDKRRK